MCGCHWSPLFFEPELVVSYVWFLDFRVSDPFSRTTTSLVCLVWETDRQGCLMVLGSCLCLLVGWLVPRWRVRRMAEGEVGGSMQLTVDHSAYDHPLTLLSWTALCLARAAKVYFKPSVPWCCWCSWFLLHSKPLDRLSRNLFSQETL